MNLNGNSLDNNNNGGSNNDNISQIHTTSLQCAKCFMCVISFYVHT